MNDVKPQTAGRTNQRHRTRKDLLAAAARLLKQGRAPTDMDEVAKEAMVSRATAYRYFPTLEALLVEAPLDGAAPDPQALFAHETSADPVERVTKAEAAMHELTYRNEAQLRLMLSASVQRVVNGEKTDGVPIRQNRRTPMIEAALAPVRDQLSADSYEKLCGALALVFGTESMIVFRDVLGIDEPTARKVKSFAIEALIDAALREALGESQK